jgi:DNA-binding transcriptional ArsR family regulator
VNDVFQVLADPTRRRLVEALRSGEHSVGQLVALVDIGQPGVSRQLAILEQARFVSMRPDGRRRLYSLRPEPFEELEEWMRVNRVVWDARLDRLGAALERRKLDVKGRRPDQFRQRAEYKEIKQSAGSQAVSELQGPGRRGAQPLRLGDPQFPDHEHDEE